MAAGQAAGCLLRPVQRLLSLSGKRLEQPPLPVKGGLFRHSEAVQKPPRLTLGIPRAHFPSQRWLGGSKGAQLEWTLEAKWPTKIQYILRK